MDRKETIKRIEEIKELLKSLKNDVDKASNEIKSCEISDFFNKLDNDKKEWLDNVSTTCNQVTNILESLETL